MSTFKIGVNGATHTNDSDSNHIIDTVENPMLEEEDTVINPLLEDEDYAPIEESPSPTWDNSAIIQASQDAQERREQLNARGIAAPGQKSKLRAQKSTLTSQDMAVLEYLALANIATARQIQTLSGISMKVVQRRMRNLESMGATWHFKGANGIHYYGLTHRAINAVATHREIPISHIKRTDPKTAAWEKLGHSIATAQAIAHLMVGRTLKEAYQARDIIPEYAIKSAMRRYQQANGWELNANLPAGNRAAMFYPFHEAQEALREDVEAAIERPELLTTIGWNASGNLPSGDEDPNSRLNEVATPDIVLLKRGGERPKYVGVEVEITPKATRTYRTIFETYFSERSDTPLSGLLYITSDPTVEARVREAAKAGERGTDYTKRISFRPLHNLEGEPFNPSSRRDYWNI